MNFENLIDSEDENAVEYLWERWCIRHYDGLQSKVDAEIGAVADHRAWVARGRL